MRSRWRMLCKIRLSDHYCFGRGTDVHGVMGIQVLGLLHCVGDRYPKCLLLQVLSIQKTLQGGRQLYAFVPDHECFFTSETFC